MRLRAEHVNNGGLFIFADSVIMLAARYTSGTEAGCDEAGRGCLAGPVVAAAVILPGHFHHPLLNDSKQLSEKTRFALRPVIESAAIACAVASCSPEEIDALNILNASFEAMHRALNLLSVKPDVILVDGNRFIPWNNTEYHCIVKGDSQVASIAAASILAKTYRDEIMISLHRQFPVYAWNKNKGYPTAEHAHAIARYGYSPHHRKSFVLKRQLKLSFTS